LSLFNKFSLSAISAKLTVSINTHRQPSTALSDKSHCY